MKIVILDENQRKLEDIEFSFGLDNPDLKKDQNIPEIDDDIKSVLNSFDYSVGVYYLSHDNIFSVSFLNNALLKNYNMNLEDAKGVPFLDLFFFHKEDNVFYNYMKEVYNTGKPKKLFLEYYDDKILLRRYDAKITKINNFVYIIGKNEANYINLDYSNLPMEQEKLFEDNYNAIAILLKDNHFAKVNKKYLEVYEQPSYEAVIGQRLGYTGMDKDLVKDIEKKYKMVIETKMYSYLFPVEINKNGKLIHYFNINASYCLYDTKPAVMIVHHDLTKEELNRRKLEKKTEESLTLNKNLDFIQSVSNSGISYELEGKYTRSSQMYHIIERQPKKTDIYRNILWDYVIKEDKQIIVNNYQKLRKDNDSTDFIVRINTAKKNLKYIHCFIRINYLKNYQENIVLLYQDVTNEQLSIKKLYNSLNESKRLNDNLKKIHRISKTGIGYYVEDKDKKEHNYNTPFKLDWNMSSLGNFKLNKGDYINYEGDLSEIILKEDLPLWQEAHKNCTADNPEVSVTVRIINGENEVAYIRCFIVYDGDNNLDKHVIFHQDITEEINKEDELRTALKDKEVLLTEVHHRVKNNLQIILSLINLNRDFDTNPETILTDTETRIYAMALIHEKIYGSTSLADVNIEEYVKSLVNSLMDTYKSDINLYYDLEPIDLTMEKSIPLGLIINELVTNTLKHAFPDDSTEGNLYIKFKKEDEKYTLIVRDDGVGLPNDFDFDSLSSLGLIVVQNLTLQIDGTLTIMDCDGAAFKVEFK